MKITHQDTIAAIATPRGNGGVGIIRISGNKAKDIAQQLVNKDLQARHAHYASFYDADQSIIDSGLAIFFPNPASFTGEDTVEIQGHGGAVIMDMLLRRILSLGGRMAKPGEFSERAFLNNKLDLAQAEAIADLIESSTEQSARSAQKSMQGVFSRQINELVEELIELRIYVEAAIDFVDEEIDFLSDGIVENRIIRLVTAIENILQIAQQGRLLRDGMTVVLAGKPNAGKSSLLNALAGHEAAIVTDVAGTTRDVLKERIQIDGMPLHIIDTAGLRDSDNEVEKEGIRRAHAEIQKADKILLLIDINDPQPDSLLKSLPEHISLTKIYNKIDLREISPEIIEQDDSTAIYLSIKQNIGMDLLTRHLKQSVGFDGTADNVFIARRRHIEALSNGLEYVQNALSQLKVNQAGELVAEDLRQAQNKLSEITGEFTSDDLLGKIFSSFCIGK
ncbi:tRNA modification GTPase [Bathymodiolus platifrons methanotrophic gill symbiont]|uniref:tRNA uridine-5-carboxymethylaminomethyl(34) synthesis GTPase MnmE n=1 Tax=Bathymodiolus platifrons methanotrophic gill symbiont TaxID=113268 RepID=UPI000B41C5DE|nr:tRNA uridine-5-carboxymethylaminomethyl(34) synthesis GTPase MnmE [Bathymodiolus platifrons methanotrophic gill symbiont]MCK5869676.1 tRNA uridine-5-carboxymethylaminomethyl(34) synthesis GTPase MnmE [Methyloprofundus sp.]TXK95186.1 tRNA uridine-5-carboxymethylaminomethyl(34) synthesis GTPase MnmE [Methylococcaceae bacterium CS4]TXK96262.1 tRNA uridine-5-carboxymethylaminomethyl(34) synthesis GTPase MnmE [Methylococcaceae bacterium CS5]TXL06163.1 tRNA uridine-5-carboxymethylaminomethyl(34) s